MVLAIAVGLGVFVVSMLLFSLATNLIVRVASPSMRTASAGFWKHVAVMMLVSLVTAAAHLVQIGVWAMALLLVGAVEAFDAAFYASAQNYTALGYGDIVITERWRLLGPLEAINGLLLFGLSTAAMFAVMSRLIVNRLHAESSTQAGALNHGSEASSDH
jgi:hypothetical protein